MSNLLLSAWFLIIATVLVGLETGLETAELDRTSPGAWLGEEGADIVKDEGCFLIESRKERRGGEAQD